MQALLLLALAFCLNWSVSFAQFPPIPPTGGWNATTNLTCVSGDRYKGMLCSQEVIKAIALRTYFDFDRCSPKNYDPACLGGFFSPEPNVTSANRTFSNLLYPSLRCCPGHYCPENAVCMIPCSHGGFCPEVETLNDTFCEPYGTVAKPYLGCGGAESDFLCPERYYCPDTVTKLACTEGHFCPAGSRRPLRCPPFSFCPPMAKAPELNLSGMIKICFVLLPIFLIVFGWRCCQDRRFKKYLNTRSVLHANRAFDPRINSTTTTVDGESYELLEVESESDEEEGLMSKDERRLLLPPTSDVHPINIVMNNLGVFIKGEANRQVLNGVSASFRAGRMTAVMGPSGAGKSVLLSVIAGRLGSSRGHTITGKILVNGVEERGQHALRRYKEVVGFVPQEDTMHRNLTVYENLAFNAHWRLPRSMSHEEQKELLFRVLDILGLKANILQSTIGDELNRGISGGERKRVNIGMELVAQPSVLLLDEPTSGLDASTCLDLVQALKVVAQAGVNVVVVLHQPRLEILELFDDLLLLAPGGVTAYAGPTANALSHFTGLGYALPAFCNPADFYMDILSGRAKPHSHKEKEAYELIHEKDIPSVYEEKEQSLPAPPIVAYHHRKQAGFFYQSWLCTKRALVQRTREIGSIITDYSLSALAGFILGLLFQALTLDKVPNVNMFISLSIGFTATQQSLRLFGLERAVYQREASTGLNSVAYFLGKHISSIPDLFLLPFIYLSMFYAAANPRGDFMAYYCTLLLTQFALSGMGNLISVLMEPAKAQIAAVVLVLILNSISGFSPLKTDLGDAGFVCYLSYGYWLMETLFLLEAEHYPDIFLQLKNDLATMLDYDLARDIRLDLGILFATGMGTRVLNYIVLRLYR